MALDPAQPHGQAQPGFGQAPGLPRTPCSPQSQGTIGSSGCPQALRLEKRPKEIGPLGAFWCFFLLLSQALGEEKAQVAPLVIRARAKVGTHPQTSAAGFRDAWGVVGVWGGSCRLSNACCAREGCRCPRDPEGRLLNPSLVLLFGSLLIVSLIGTSRFMIKIKPTG